MSIVAVADIQAETPTLVLSSTSVPNTTQVTGYIAEIENEVRARLEAAPATWPADGTPQALYLKSTIVEGVIWKTLRAKYAMSRSEGRPPEIAEAYKSYSDRLNNVALVARSIQNVTDTQTGQSAARTIPQVARGYTTPDLSSSFGEYTQARDQLDYANTMNRWQGNRPWPLL